MLPSAPTPAEPGLPRPAATPPPPVPAPASIAHWTHTLALFGVLCLTTAAGRMRTLAPAAQAEPHFVRYLSSMLLEWLLLGAVIAGIYRRGPFLLGALRSRAHSAVTALLGGVPVYMTGMVVLACVALALLKTPLHNKTNEAVILALVPHTPLEYIAWLGVSMTAGITEELIFRGYLLQQLNAWTRRPYLSIVLAALLFGSVHLYEGLAAILPLAGLAIVYGLVVRYMRGDLRAVIVAHTLQDFLVPFLLLARDFALKHQPMHHI